MKIELSKVYTGTNLIDFLEGHIEGKEIIYIKLCKDEKFRIKEAKHIYKYLEELSHLRSNEHYEFRNEKMDKHTFLIGVYLHLIMDLQLRHNGNIPKGMFDYWEIDEIFDEISYIEFQETLFIETRKRYIHYLIFLLDLKYDVDPSKELTPDFKRKRFNLEIDTITKFRESLSHTSEDLYISELLLELEYYKLSKKSEKKTPLNRSERIDKRNKEIRQKYENLTKDNPSKSQEAMRTLAEEYDRSISTIRDIIYK